MTKVVLNWIFCGCLFSFGLLILFGSIEKRLLQGVFAGAVFIITAFITTPHMIKKIEKKRGAHFLIGHKLIIAFGGLVLGLLFVNPKKENTTIVKEEVKPAQSLPAKVVETKKKSMDMAELQKQLSTELGALPKHWQSVTVDKVEDTTYGATLIYKESPTAGEFQFTIEGKIIVKAMLNVLVKNGHKPSEDLLNIRVNLQELVVGETGKELVRFFGRSRYNPVNDQIEFSDKLYGF